MVLIFEAVLFLLSVKVSKEQEENLIEFFETLEEEDDVQNIFSNVKLNIN